MFSDRDETSPSIAAVSAEEYCQHVSIHLFSRSVFIWLIVHQLTLPISILFAEKNEKKTRKTIDQKLV